MLGEADLPTFPGVAVRALEELRDPDFDLRKVARLVETDPGLSVAVLRAANSALYSLRNNARTVGHAVGLLGRGRVESLLLTISVREALPRPRTPWFDPGEFWHAAALRGTLARGIAERICPTRASEAFTAALLQDLAMPLLAERVSDKYAPVLERWRAEEGPLVGLERSTLGWDHAEIGLMLAEMWGFPMDLCGAIAGHHELAEQAVPTPERWVAGLGSGAELPDSLALLGNELVDRGVMGEADATDLIDAAQVDALETAGVFAA